MSDEEDDFMSDKFLTGSHDGRCSLVHNRAKRRLFEVENKQKEQIKKQKKKKKLSSAVFNNDTLQDALSKPLAEENKGFKLLAKMGYKAGQPLGKPISSEPSSSSAMEHRLVAPIGITLKTDRQGLGSEAALKDLNEKRHQLRELRLQRELEDMEEYLHRTNHNYEEVRVLNTLTNCQMTCENLDLESNMDKPKLPWFWPDKTTEIKEKADKNKEDATINTENEARVVAQDEDEFSNKQKVEMLTNYMRTSYMYCYWCGVRYNDEEDLNSNCPGLTTDDH